MSGSRIAASASGEEEEVVWARVGVIELMQLLAERKRFLLLIIDSIVKEIFPSLY